MIGLVNWKIMISIMAIESTNLRKRSKRFRTSYFS